MVQGNRDALEDVILGVLQGQGTRVHRGTEWVSIALNLRQDLLVGKCEPRTLFRSQFMRRDLGEFVSPRFPNQHRDLVVRRPAAVLRNELLDCLIPLDAALAELRE